MDDNSVFAGDEQRSPTPMTLADPDHTSSGSDQTSADRDQLASDRDQAASDRDLEAGSDPKVNDLSSEVRQRTPLDRHQTADARLDAASTRDATADVRDLAALARDHAADARTLAMTRSDASYDHENGARSVTGDEILMLAAGARKLAAWHRGQSAEQRSLATEDRHDAAHDREQAAAERHLSLVDREALALQVATAETDPLTGAHGRAAGLRDLGVELERCRRTSGLLVVAYVDVVGLKRVNDSEGHLAGDRLLQRIVKVITKHLRPYDLVIRLGGDEFLFAISNMTLLEARQRFSVIAAVLADRPTHDAVSVGFAELAPEDSATQLIARADNELTERRRINHDSRHGSDDTGASQT